MPPGQLLDRIMAESPSIEDDRTVLLAQLRGLIPHLHNTDLAAVPSRWPLARGRRPGSRAAWRVGHAEFLRERWRPSSSRQS